MIIGSVFRDAYAANFNGSDEYAYIADPSFKSNTQGCFALRVRMATLLGSNGFKNMIGYGTTSGSNDSMFGLRQFRGANTSNQNRMGYVARLTNGGTSNSLFGGTSLSATTTYSMVMQSNDSTVSMYLNGSAETLTAGSGSNNGSWMGDISGTNHRLSFGSAWVSNAASAYNDCRLNECIYLARPLTGSEITEWHNSGTTRNPHRMSFAADIVSWWRFGDSRDTGSTIYDEIGSNHLTTVNMDSSNYGTP